MAAPSTIELTLPNYGTLLGEVDQKRQVAIFRNVPYATVPERWRAAVKATPWTGIRDATKQGPICPQPPSGYVLTQIAPKEVLQAPEAEHDELHCLNLNIVVPLKALKTGASGTEAIPVMTWIHGGAFKEGSNDVPLYDAVNFVQRSIQLDRPVIVVGVNYRLNVFGFLASKELQQELESSPEYASLSPYDRSVGNWGLMDQKLAFEWVRENISAFGGNPKNVTAFGESAGSISLHYHMILPSHYGLFDHAIMQSGTVNTIPAGHVHQEGQGFFETLLRMLNIPTDLDSKEKMRRLRALPQEELTRVIADIPDLLFRPHYDNGKVFPAQSTNASKSNSIQILSQDTNMYDPRLKSVLLGANKDEGTAFVVPYFGEANVQSWPDTLKKIIPVPPALTTLLESAYGVPETDADVIRIISTIVGDMIFLYPTQLLGNTLLQLQEARGANRFKLLRYHFDAEITKMNEIVPGLGALHGGDILFVFGPPMIENVLTEKELYLSAEMQSLWIMFANQQDYAAKGIISGQGQAAASENGEAWVMTKEHEIERGKSDRLTEDAMAFWGKIAQGTVEKAEAGFLNLEP
ncbi:hypothetical protein BGX28_001714 [Mortierella sp. GBA30]|nr:hypothetical protein BGX28_001714 [Mortierella sp. GBA30]